LTGYDGVFDLRVRQSSFLSLQGSFLLIFQHVCGRRSHALSCLFHARALACSSPGPFPSFSLSSLTTRHHAFSSFLRTLSHRFSSLSGQFSTSRCRKSDNLLCRLIMCQYERKQNHTRSPTHWLFCSPRHTSCPRHDVQPVIRFGSASRNPSAR
jgi:hypothetical protein